MVGQLSPLSISGIIFAYFSILIALSWWLNRKGSDNDDFFIGSRQSPWLLVAIGMIGASLSGVTFISIPGAVGGEGLNKGMSYMQVVFGYLVGYLVIATLLLPLYYKLRLTSIYEYLGQRLGKSAYQMGAFYFLLSRTIGASFRLFLVAVVLQEFVTGPLGLPFWGTVGITILLIWLYTFQGGIKTIVYTDVLQTVCMLAAVGLTISYVTQAMDINLGGAIRRIQQSNYNQLFYFEGGWTDPNNFFKQFFSGALITIVMTGLDQDMMQKNLSISNLKDAQKNMALFSVVLVIANILFLGLGALLYIYAAEVGLPIPNSTDQLYPTVALLHLPAMAGLFFIIGLIAAAYSSADSALTSLTTSFCVDFLRVREAGWEADKAKRARRITHIGFSLLLFLVILAFQLIKDKAVINSLFTAAGYTYGPLLGLFSFGLFTNLRVREFIPIGKFQVPVLVLVCLVSPIISFLVNTYSVELLNGFQFGFLILAFNGLLTFIGLLALSDFSTNEIDETT